MIMEYYSSFANPVSDKSGIIPISVAFIKVSLPLSRERYNRGVVTSKKYAKSALEESNNI